MAKKIYTVLKLKDEFTPGIKKAAASTEALAVKAKASDYHAKQLGKTMRGNLAKGAKVAAAAVAAVGAAAVATGKKLVQETMQQADTVDKMSQKIGISRQAYQEMDFVTSQCGASIDNMKMGMKTLTKQMQSAAQGSQTSVDAFNALGVSIYDSSGKLRSQEDMMWDAFSALQGMTNQTEKAAIANQLFGRAGSELMPMLNGSAGSIEKMRKQARELGLVMSDETVDAGVKLTDTMDQAKRALSAVAMRIGAKLLPYAQAAGDYLITHLPQIESAAEKAGQFIGKLGDGIEWVADKSNILIPLLAGVVAGITAFKVISTVSALIGAWTAVTSAYAAAQGVANMTMLACPLTWIVIGITAVVAAGVALWKNWDTVCKWAGKFKERLMTCGGPIGAFRDKILTIVSVFKSVTSWVGKAINGLKKFLGMDANKTIKVKTIEEGAAAGTSILPKIPKHATGSAYFAGGMTGFSEGGRAESAIFPSGTKIVPANKTQKETSGTGPITVTVIIQGDMIGEDKYASKVGKQVAKEIREALAG